jgi:hypothetical protein
MQEANKHPEGMNLMHFLACRRRNGGTLIFRMLHAANNNWICSKGSERASAAYGMQNNSSTHELFICFSSPCIGGVRAGLSPACCPFTFCCLAFRWWHVMVPTAADDMNDIKLLVANRADSANIPSGDPSEPDSSV